MPEVHLSICTHYLPLESYVNDVLRYLKDLFNICIDDQSGPDETNTYREFKISTDHNPFELKMECMHLEKRDGRRIGDIDIEIYYKTIEGWKTRKKISRNSTSFISWRIKNYFEKTLNQSCDFYFLSHD